MSLIAKVTQAAERLPLPDRVTRAGIASLVGRTRRRLVPADPQAVPAFVEGMAAYPIAEHTDEANAQHYELPSQFFGLILGPNRKYSCCFYGPGDTLAMAEDRALAASCEHADLVDGQSILELGCGWGSLTLFMASRYPRSTITAVSNSASQRAHIEAQAAGRKLGNVRVVTADMNTFDPQERFDRIVSVEMFEHMANWQPLLQRVRDWLLPAGKLFLHVFTHKSRPYRFDHRNDADWIAQHFFTGGIMPSHELIYGFDDLFSVEKDWRWSGEHYARTADDWLANFDAWKTEIDVILQDVYGADAKLWRRRWRLFFLATSGLFGHAKGTEWGVSHYRLKPRS